MDDVSVLFGDFCVWCFCVYFSVEFPVCWCHSVVFSLSLEVVICWDLVWLVYAAMQDLCNLLEAL